MEQIKSFMRFLLDIYHNRGLLVNLVKNDLKSRNSGALFGTMWVFAQPLVTILVFWYVFQVGFRNSPVNNVQFIVWFVAGYIPWIFFNDAVLSSSNCLYEYSFLVKKIKFRTSLLPIVKVISSTCIHLFFMLFTIFIYIIYGYSIEWAWLNIIYYSFCLFVLSIGVSWIVSSVSVFLKDFSQLVNILLQIGFWLAPIFWNPGTMSESVMRVLKLNPIYYIIVGYRSCLIDGIPFWDRGPITYYYWAVTMSIFIIGATVFRRLRAHFADIL